MQWSCNIKWTECSHTGGIRQSQFILRLCIDQSKVHQMTCIDTALQVSGICYYLQPGRVSRLFIDQNFCVSTSICLILNGTTACNEISHTVFAYQ